MKKITLIVAIALLAILVVSLTACGGDSGTNSIYGKYYEYENGVKNPDSCFELKAGKKWEFGTDSGEFTLEGNVITIIFEGEEFMTGTVENGVLILEVLGMPAGVFYKDGAYGSNLGNGASNGNNTVKPVEPDEKASIKSIVNGSVDGMDCFLDVSPLTANIDLSGSIEVSKDSSWQLYADVLGQTLIPTKYAANLVDGDNIYYIVVNSADGTVNRTYTLHIWRNFNVDIVFYSQGEIVKTLTRTTHTTIPAEEFSAVSRTGYTFGGWEGHTEGENYYITGYNNYGALAKTITFESKWIANKYTIRLDANGGSCGASNKSVTYDNYFELPKPTRTGYTFIGWEYNGTQITTPSGSCITGYAYDRDITAIAMWSINSYQLTVNKDGNYGTVTSSGKKQYNSSVTITATPNAGYNFAGWYKGGTKVSDSTSYTFTMPANDVTYTAKWTYYTVSTETNLVGAGAYTDKNKEKVTIGESVALTATTNLGYTWLGWYDGDTLLTTELSYCFTMPANNVTYTAKWMPCPVTLEKNIAEAGTVSGVERTVLGKETTITATTNPGYTWLGWYEGNTKVSEGTSMSYTFTMPANDVTYTAKWMGCPVTLEKNIAEAGIVSGVERTALGGETTITATTNPGYTWLGWYEGNTKVSEGTSMSYTFTMPANDVTYTAKWIPCPVTLEKNIAEAGTVSGVERTAVGAETTITATNNPGYIFLGWYDGDTLLTDKMEYTIAMTAESKTYTAKWEIDAELQNFYYTITPTSCTITGIKDETVISIIIPDSVTTIGDYAFRGCRSLTSVTIPASVTRIGKYAFYNCDGLISVTFGENSKLTTIGDYAFEGCINLTNVTFGDDSKLTTIGRYAFYGCWSLTSIIIPSGVTSIGSSAFEFCSNLTSITIHASVTSFGDYAFAECYALAEVYNYSSLNITKGSDDYGLVAYYALDVYTTNEPSKLTTDENGFIIHSNGTLVRYIGTATEITIPDSVTTIGARAFSGCSSLTSVTIGDSVTSFGDFAFSSCTSLTSVTFGENSQLTTIGSYAFQGCSSLISITIPNSVTTIGSSAFYGCYTLAEVYNYSSLNIKKRSSNYGYVAYYALDVYTTNQPSKLTTDENGFVIHTNGEVKTLVRYIGTVTEITIPDSVTTIGNGAFRNCRSLTSVTFGENSQLTTIGDWAFDGCRSLTSVTIPASVTTIGKYAFYGCTKLTSITIPDSVTTIGSYAFYNCDSLTSITIPASVTTIGFEAFYNCDSLTSVTFEDTTGWYVTKTEGATSGTNLTLTNTLTNAKYLTDTYSYYYWYKK